MSAPKAITNLQEFKHAISGDTYAVVDFWATWCGPCKAISPVFKKMATESTNGNLAFYTVDVDDVPDVAEEVGIRSMPTFTLFKNGEKVDQFSGAIPAQLQTLITKAT